MKKLLFAVSALAALSLLAPSAGFAQFTYSNQVGLYTTSDGLGLSETFAIGAPVDVYLVLTMPTNTNVSPEVPYATINAFECTLNFSSVVGMFKLLDAMAPSVNVGDTANFGSGYLEYIVGFGANQDVVNGAVSLVHFQFMHLVPGLVEITLGPSSKPSIPGEMVFQSVSGQLRAMYSAAGAHANPVFKFDGNTVPVETESFGTVKALFR